MRYIKLYEDFRYEAEIFESVVKLRPEDLNKTIDDVLEPEFFEQESDKQVTQDKRGVYHISGWNVY